MGKPHEALEICEQASRRDPQFAPIYYLKVKGEALAQLDRLKEALEACEQAERHEFYEPRSRSNLLGLKAILLYFLHDLEGALATYNEQLAIDPLCVLVALPQKATVLRDLSRYSEMVTTLEPALRWNRKDAEVYKLLVEALWHLGRFDEAIPHTLKIIDLEPNYVKAYEELAYLFVTAGRLDEAWKMCERAIELGPIYPTSTYWARGETLYHWERYDEALATYQLALTYPPDSFSDWARQGIEKTRQKLDISE